MLSRYEDPGTNFGAVDTAGNHGMIQKFYKPADTRMILEKEYRERMGRMVVAGEIKSRPYLTSFAECIQSLQSRP